MVENSIKLTPFKTITLELYSVQTSMEEPSIDSIENTVYFGLPFKTICGLTIIYSEIDFFQDHSEEEKNIEHIAVQ